MDRWSRAATVVAAAGCLLVGALPAASGAPTAGKPGAAVVVAAAPAVRPPAAAAAASRGADLWYMRMEGDRFTDCARVVHVDARGRAVSNRGAGCTGFFRDVHAGVRTGHVGEYGEEAPLGLWTRSGSFLGVLRGSVSGGLGACFTSGGDSDWRLVCTPVSASAAVFTEYGSGTGQFWLRLLRLHAAPRRLAAVPYLAGAVVAHGGRTVYAWTSHRNDWEPGESPGRDVLVSVDVATGRTRTLLTAPLHQQYRTVCTTWSGRAVVVQERRVRHQYDWSFVPVAVLSVSASGRASRMGVPGKVAVSLQGCTADGRILFYGTGTDDRPSMSSYDLRRRASRYVLGTRTDTVDNG